jgi:phosphoribosylaminoimidazole-succinocarboxamide synthase
LSKRRDLLYEGKAKKVYAAEDPALCVVEYKDDATALDGAKKGSIPGKGAINNRLTNHFMTLLEKSGVATHYAQELNDRETLVKKVEIVPLEVIARNIAAGSLAKRLGLTEGFQMSRPVLEFCYKSDALGDPMVNEYHIAAMGWASPEEVSFIARSALRINEILTGYLKGFGVELVDFKLEFGRLPGGSLLLADEISPDTCRFWDSKTGEKLDKDRFRRDMGGVEGAYQEIYRRIFERVEG